jgi:hypothetical protein
MISYFIHSADLGDLLFSTALFKHNIGSEMILEDHPKTRYASRLYSEFVNVRFVPNPLPFDQTINTWRIDRHKSQQILDRFNLGHLDCIPYIKIPEENKRILKAKKDLSYIKNPVYVNFETRAFNQSSDPITYYRVPPPEVVGIVVDILKAYGYTPVAFPVSPESHRKINGIEYIYGVDLLDLAAYCKVIGKYIGIDSGTLHLMLAVGGKTIGIVPPSHDIAFPHPVYLWLSNVWTQQPCRAIYKEFKDIYKIENDIKYFL